MTKANINELNKVEAPLGTLYIEKYEVVEKRERENCSNLLEHFEIFDSNLKPFESFEKGTTIENKEDYDEEVKIMSHIDSIEKLEDNFMIDYDFMTQNKEEMEEFIDQKYGHNLIIRHTAEQAVIQIGNWYFVPTNDYL